jgi:UDP-N-acetylglucosamine acyltransferase
VIHETAIIHPTAVLADDVNIGPWSIVGAEVTIGAGTKIASHVVLKGPTTIGKNNQIFQFASVGDDPQDMKYKGERTFLELGDGNIIRESCTINRGTEHGGSTTRVGDHNLFMAYVHIAHDCIVGSHTIFANNASLAGHVSVNDHVVLGGFSAVRQFITLGEHSFVAGGTMVVKDVLPYVLVAGVPAETFGLNVVGLKRRGFTADTMKFLRRAYKVIYRQGLTVKKALEELEEMVGQCPEIESMIEALRASSRGIIR